jgi:hypothetical protein
MIKNLLFVLSFLIIQSGLSQQNGNSNANSSNFTNRGHHWLDLNLGLSFFISNEAALNEFAVLTNEKPDYFGFLIQPKYQYFAEDNWSVGFHLGFGHENLFENDVDLDQSNQVYFTGIQTEYFFLELKNIFYLSAELNANLQYLVRDSINSNLYFKSGLNLITSFLIKDNFLVYIKLSDFISYTTNEDNFFRLDKGFSFNNSFDNFINFPQFGIRFNLF